MTKSSIVIDLDDPRTAEIAEVISNKTAKKILSTLAERELNATELSNEMKMPLNTIGYNLTKLESAGLIEKSNKFMWSVKGKRVHKYKISNKRITISPKSLMKGIIPTALITGVFAFLIKIFAFSPQTSDSVTNTLSSAGADYAMETSAGAAGAASSVAVAEGAKIAYPGIPPAAEICNNAYQTIVQSNSWAWFLMGSIVALIVLLLLNWRKK